MGFKGAGVLNKRRERIRLLEIHQMNCLDEGECLRGMPFGPARKSDLREEWMRLMPMLFSLRGKLQQSKVVRVFGLQGAYQKFELR